MGIYTEYLDKRLNFKGLTEERKRQLTKISEIRKRDVLVFASDLSKRNSEISIEYSDLLPIKDQLEYLDGTKLDLILETPGGSGTITEDIVKLLRVKYDEVAVIVPGSAKSAGTIIAMSADEILMEKTSALGPIDTQMFWEGKVFSADALLDGFKKIKTEVAETNQLNLAYIPMLQNISLGDLENAQNAKDFSIKLVKEWLVEYKFSNWKKHSSDERLVTLEEREKRAEEIANALSKHKHWLIHGKSIKIEDLRKLKLKIEDYSEKKELCDAIQRYFILLQMTLQTTNMYKVFETETSQIYRFGNVFVPVPVPVPAPQQQGAGVRVDLRCTKCGNKIGLFAHFKGRPRVPVPSGCVPFPKDNKVKCGSCHSELDILDVRRTIESQTKEVII